MLFSLDFIKVRLPTVTGNGTACMQDRRQIDRVAAAALVLQPTYGARSEARVSSLSLSQWIRRHWKQRRLLREKLQQQRRRLLHAGSCWLLSPTPSRSLDSGSMKDTSSVQLCELTSPLKASFVTRGLACLSEFLSKCFGWCSGFLNNMARATRRCTCNLATSCPLECADDCQTRSSGLCPIEGTRPTKQDSSGAAKILAKKNAN
jgi:hypothetical protein